VSRSFVRFFALQAIVLLVISSFVWAQAGTATIRGLVSDPQGSVIANALVTVTNQATKATRSTKTSLVGVYTFDLLPPGDYTVEIDAPGFSKFKLTDVRAQVGNVSPANATLQIGVEAAVVEVKSTSTAVQVNTQDATLGNNFISEQITQLPMEARNVGAILTLQPGVTREGYVAGARSDQSNITLDGVDINEAQTNSLASPVLRLNAEAIEEFRVTTVNANASQGRSSAAQVNLVTKSGTNSFHGSAFEFHRNTVFTANNFFNNRSGVERPALIRNTFGGAIGGPVVKDKVFFFYSYEGRRDASAAAVGPRTVPLPTLGQGLLRYRAAGNTVVELTTAQLNDALTLACNNDALCVTPLTINPAAVAAMAAAASAYPHNDFTTGDSQSGLLLNTAGFRFNSPIKTGLNSHVGRMDFNASTKHNFFVRANAIHDLVGASSFFPDTPTTSTWDHPWGGVAGHTWTITNNVVNNFRYGYTRAAFSTLGDSGDNDVSFRFVFSPRAFSRTLSRVTPVHNITNDTSWIRGTHTIQFGTNLRFISNSRASFGLAYDVALANPTLYQGSGAVVTNALANYIASQGLPAMAAPSQARDAFTTLIGRMSQYQARFTFDSDGSLLPAGTPTARDFRAQEYDFYIQDTWKPAPSLTVTLGLRYGLSRPIYEVNGFEVKPTVSLSEIFDRRNAASAAGQEFTEDIILDLSGPANGRSPMYHWDKNNFQPRVAIAWSPDAGDNGFLKAILGGHGRSVIRTGFAVTNDYYGQALAVNFDLANQLGFASQQVISANTYNITSRPAPLFTGYDMDVRSLQNINPPASLTYPQNRSANNARRIESSLDEGLVAPLNYMWNLTFERELPKDVVMQFSYIGRLGRKLLAQRDILQPANLVDPATGVDWYSAATLLEIERQKGTPINQIQSIPYFENLFPTFPLLFGATNVTQSIYSLQHTFLENNDWTFGQDTIDAILGTNFFFHPQYATLSAWGTTAHSNYHALTVSARQRYRGVTWDFNYTFSHSTDDASGLQSAANFSAGAFLVNTLQQRRNYANSDFDIRHGVNFNSVWELPIGRGKRIGGNAGSVLNGFIGGWQISGIFRWNTGLPIYGPVETGRWPTNWQISSRSVQIQDFEPCPTRGDATTAPKLFGCDPDAAYLTFRNAYPGEIGDRNKLRIPGFVGLDLGVSKSFNMPVEGHHLQFRWEVFNFTNTQRLSGVGGFVTEVDNILNGLSAPTNWSNFTTIQGTPRVMQVGLRYTF